MQNHSQATVTRNDEAERYEIAVDGGADGVVAGGVAGFAAFHESATHVAFTHTEVFDAYQGQGLASRLAAAALADAVARDKIIIPLCPYIARYLERHEIEGAVIEWPNRAPRE
jgi:predicted GNAT family acetyltransferase